MRISIGNEKKEQKLFRSSNNNKNNNNNNNNNPPLAYGPLGPTAVIIRIHMQPVSTVFFFLQTVVSALLPSKHDANESFETT